MKAHKYWSLGALVSIIGTFLICMIMAIYSGHKLIAGNKKTIKHTDFTEVEE